LSPAACAANYGALNTSRLSANHDQDGAGDKSQLDVTTSDIDSSILES